MKKISSAKLSAFYLIIQRIASGHDDWRGGRGREAIETACNTRNGSFIQSPRCYAAHYTKDRFLKRVNPSTMAALFVYTKGKCVMVQKLFFSFVLKNNININNNNVHYKDYVNQIAVKKKKGCNCRNPGSTVVNCMSKCSVVCVRITDKCDNDIDIYDILFVGSGITCSGSNVNIKDFGGNLILMFSWWKNEK